MARRIITQSGRLEQRLPCHMDDNGPESRTQVASSNGDIHPLGTCGRYAVSGLLPSRMFLHSMCGAVPHP